jgi:alpha-galactosidase
VYAPDRSEALVSFAQLTTGASLTPPMLRLPGLDVDRRYRVVHVPLPGERWDRIPGQPQWLADGIDLSGRQLAVHGIRPPVLPPESAALLHLVAR